LAMNEGWELAFDFVDTTKLNIQAKLNALRALAMMHQPEVVSGLIEHLAKATDPSLR